MAGKPGFRALPRRIGQGKGKFPIPTGTAKPQMKVTGEPMPFAVTCCGCNKVSQVPDFDPKNPPDGFICCHCKLKHRMKFNKSIHKWEIIPVREGEQSVQLTGDADGKANTG